MNFLFNILTIVELCTYVGIFFIKTGEIDRMI